MDKGWASKVENKNKLTNITSATFYKIDFSLETLQQILNLLLENEKYEKEDIRLVSQYLFSIHECRFEKQFVITSSIDQLKKVLKRKISGSNTIPLFIMHDKSDRHWAAFCFLEMDGKMYLLCKNSCDNTKSEIENIAKECLIEVIFKLHDDKSFTDKCCCGLLSLKNLEIMLQEFKTNQSNFITNFDKIQFCSLSAVTEVRKTFTANLRANLGQVLTQDILCIANDMVFKEAVVEFIGTCSKYLDMPSSSKHYIKVLQNAASKSEESINEINLDEIEKAKNSFLNDPITKELLEKQVCLNLNSEEGKEIKINNNDISLNIQNNFPEQMKKFTSIFNLLVQTKDYESSKTALELVCRKFGIDPCKIENFFSVQNENTKQKDVGFIELAISDVNKIKSHVPLLKTKPNPDEKTFEVLLKELTTTMEYAFISRFIDHHYKIKTFYQEWKNKDELQINDWAKRIKGKLRVEEMLEALAVMDRANEIVTGGHRLRDTQILTLLIFLQHMEKSHVCQIHTGEGKTTTISLLATLKVLQGKYVDIITSNEVLAKEGCSNREEFFHLFNISVATNNSNSSHIQGTKACYSCDVVYGTIGNFQFDYLTDSFEGQETRGGRGFETVILDEVDSMLIDNGSYIAKLTGPFPGMDSLKYVYLKIWQELCNAERNMFEEFKKSLKNRKECTAIEHLQFNFEQLHRNIAELKCKVKASDPSNISLIPAHLKEYARSMVDKWIDNAMYARYECLENEQYVIKKKDGEDVIVPVDYQNTGVLLKNTIWCNGLHQFVQLKHNLCLTMESLTSSFISNIGYIKLYNQEVFGVTGTLGSLAERQLLSKIYSLAYTEVPSFKKRKFSELEGFVVKDHRWSSFIAIYSLMLTHKDRSVLIICRTIKDLKDIEDKITYFKESRNFNRVKVKTYPDEDSSSIVNVEIGSGEIIIATNIAGRGTDFKTSLELEGNGGLHVCVSFLPVNQRVEDQAFGRTARQGNSGTAQLIFKYSDVVEIGIDARQIPKISFKKIKELRDWLEMQRLQEVQNVKLSEIDFQDNLFSEFSKLYREFKKSSREDASNLYLAKDLKEFWAFWLHKNSFRGSSLKELNVNDEFERFLHDAKNILGSRTLGKFCSGRISHNPYYSIQQAEYFLDRNEITKAKAALTHALGLNAENNGLLHSAHMKLFEVSVESGNQMYDRFKKAVEGVLFFDFFKDIEKDENYKLKAKDALDKAQSSIAREIDYIKQNFISYDEVSNETGPVYSISSNFQNILTDASENNILLKHIISKFVTLNIFYHQCKSLLKQVENSLQKHKTKGLIIKARIPNYLKKLDSNTEHEMYLKKAITDIELSELSSVGLDTIYELQNVHDVPHTVIKSVQVQICAGLSLISVGVAYPPAATFLAPLAGILISEGIFDIIFELVSQGASEFNSKAYLKSKCISYGIALATLGIVAIVKSTEMLDYAIKQSKRLSIWLKKSADLKSVFDSLSREFKILYTLFNYVPQTSSIGKLVVKPGYANLTTSLCKLAILCPTMTKMAVGTVLATVAWKYLVPKNLIQQCSNWKRDNKNRTTNTKDSKQYSESDKKESSRTNNSQQERKSNADNQKDDDNPNDQNQESEDSNHEDQDSETTSSEEESDLQDSEEELDQQDSGDHRKKKRKKSNHNADKDVVSVLKQLIINYNVERCPPSGPSYHDPSFVHKMLNIDLFYKFLSETVKNLLQKKDASSMKKLRRIYREENISPEAVPSRIGDFLLVGSCGELKSLYPKRKGIAEVNHSPPSKSYENTPYQHIKPNDRPGMLIPIHIHRSITISTGSSYLSEIYRKDISIALHNEGGFYAALYTEIWHNLTMYLSLYMSWPDYNPVRPYDPIPSLKKLVIYCSESHFPDAPLAPGVPLGCLISENDRDTLLSFIEDWSAYIRAVYKRFPNIKFPGGLVHIPSLLPCDEPSNAINDQNSNETSSSNANENQNVQNSNVEDNSTDTNNANKSSNPKDNSNLKDNSNSNDSLNSSDNSNC